MLKGVLEGMLGGRTTARGRCSFAFGAPVHGVNLPKVSFEGATELEEGEDE